MTALFTITTVHHELEHLSRVRPLMEFDKLYQAFPGDTVPVCCQVDGKMQWVSAIWGIDHYGKSLTSIPMEKILVKKPFNVWFRKWRCAIPVNCFFVKNNDDVFLIRILKQRAFMLGGICLPPDNEHPNFRFAILEVDAADILSRITVSMPINFRCDKTESWVRQKTVLNIMQMADSSSDRWFDFYKVDPGILTRGSNNREFLKPVGISYREWTEREEKLNSLDLKGDRYSRNNSKGRH